MKPQLIRPPANSDSSFRVNNDPHRYFYNPLHFHPELELTYITESYGTRFVGNSVENFDAGDMVLVGANLPHCWKNHHDFFKPNSKLKAVAIVVQFTETFAGLFFDLPEMGDVKNLFWKARRGLKISGETKEQVVIKMEELLELNGYKKVRQLLDILHLLAISNDLKYLSHEILNLKTVTSDTERLNRVYQYAMNHYDQYVSLEEIADIASMSKTAFCRYFKKNTRKTFSNFMNEIRINHASKFLTDSNQMISQVAYRVGFANLSNFIRQFRKVKGMSPLQYRQKHKLLL